MAEVTIAYCVVWNYYARAVRLKEELWEEFGDQVAVTLKKSTGGRFDVYLDEKLIFSKTESFRFPEIQDIIQKITAIS